MQVIFLCQERVAAPYSFLLSKNWDKAAAVRFFKKAIGSHEAPEKIALDGNVEWRRHDFPH